MIGNSLVAILLYAFLCWWTVRPVRPILHGLPVWPMGKRFNLQNAAASREVAAGINAASGELQRRDAALEKKDEARANWIAGISHDIRTPLSVILGYAGELQDDPALPPQEQEQAAVICRQGNSPTRPGERSESCIAFGIRHAASGISAVASRQACSPHGYGFYECHAGESLRHRTRSHRRIHSAEGGRAAASARLDKPSPKQCSAQSAGLRDRIAVRREDGFCLILYDDGVGADPQKLENLLNAPYAPKRAHGLGLFLVRRITEAHGGQFIAHTAPGQGFSCEMKLPCEPFIKGSPRQILSNAAHREHHLSICNAVSVPYF